MSGIGISPFLDNVLFDGITEVQDYYLRQQLPDGVRTYNPLPIMDGNKIASVDGVIYSFGGWNPSTEVFDPGPSTNRCFKSLDDGTTWEEIDAAPWSARHVFGIGVKAGKILIWGGDVHTTVKDVWEFDPSDETWTELTSDWGFGERIVFSYGIDAAGYLYVIGGTDIAGNPVNDTYRSLDGVTWSKTGDLPLALTSFQRGVAWFPSATEIVIANGGPENGALESLNPYVYKTTNGGASWSLVSTIPEDMRCTHGDAFDFDGKMWHVMGWANEMNVAGLWYSTNKGATWTEFDQAPSARHAAGACSGHTYSVTGEEVAVIVAGNMHNDCYILRTVDYPYEVHEDLKWWWTGLETANLPTSGLMEDLNEIPLVLDFSKVRLLNIVGGLENDDQRLLPLKTTSFKPVLNIGTGVTLASTGATGGAGKALDLNWNYADDGQAGDIQNTAMAVYHRTTNGAGGIDMGASQGALFTTIWARDTDGNFYGDLNDTAPAFVSSGVTVGFKAIERNGEDNRNIILDTTVTAANISPSLTINPLNLYGCAMNDDGVIASTSTKENSMFAVVETSERANLRAATVAFYTARGINV